MTTGRTASYAAGGGILLVAGVALLLIPPHTAAGLGILLVILSSVPFSLAYSSSMRAERRS